MLSISYVELVHYLMAWFSSSLRSSYDGIDNIIMFEKIHVVIKLTKQIKNSLLYDCVYIEFPSGYL